MRSRLLLCILIIAASAFAKELKPYQSGELLRMDSVRCGIDEKDMGQLTGEMRTDSGHEKTHELLCQEYLLQAEGVIYRIRPHATKHPVLLPVGNRAQFRLEKDKMFLRTEDVDGKERQYLVVSMKPRTDANTADATSARVNHLQ